MQLIGVAMLPVPEILQLTDDTLKIDFLISLLSVPRGTHSPASRTIVLKESIPAHLHSNVNATH